MIPPVPTDIAGILKAAGYSAGEMPVCPGKAAAGCLVSLNLFANLDAAAVDVGVDIDPNQTVLPLNMFLSGNPSLSFEIESGETGKTTNAEGLGIDGNYVPADFSAARMFAQLNPLPMTTPVSRERPMTLRMTNADAMNEQETRGTMLAIATDQKGRVPEQALRYHLSKMQGARPQVISLCARGYRSIGGGVAEVPSEWCDGSFPAGAIVPLRITPTTLAAGVPATISVGPLQPMIPLALDLTGSGDTTFTIIDPNSGKDARIQGDTVLANPALTGSDGSALSPNFTAADFTPAQFQSGFNHLPWTQLSPAIQERPLQFVATSVAGAVFQGFCWALVLSKDLEVPGEAMAYARTFYNGAPVPLAA